MKYKHYGWLRWRTHGRWYQVVESNHHDECLEALRRFAQEGAKSKRGRGTVSMVVLPHGMAPVKKVKK